MAILKEENVPEAPAQGPSNGTIKDEYGKGAAEGAKKLVTQSPSQGGGKVKV